MADETGEMAFRKLVGRRLQDARKRQGLSIDTVADHFSVSRAAVGHWETGKNPMDLGRLYLLARLYRATVFSLVAEQLTNEDVLALMRQKLEGVEDAAQSTNVGVDKLGGRHFTVAPAPSSVPPAQAAAKAPHTGKQSGAVRPKHGAPAKR